MNFLNSFMNIFLSVPFLAELALFMVLSVPWVLIQEKSGKPLTGPPSQGLVRLLAVAVLIVGLLKVGLSMGFGQGLPVWMLITYILISGAIFAFSRWAMRFQVFLALCLGCGIFLVAQVLFTGVQITRTYAAHWNIQRPDAIGQMSDQPDYIQFSYDAAPEYFDYIYSDKVSTFLMIEKKPKAELEVRLMYQWGLLVDHRIEKVNGMSWQRAKQDEAGVSGSSSGPGPFPTYYFGLGDPAPAAAPPAPPVSPH